MKPIPTKHIYQDFNEFNRWLGERRRFVSMRQKGHFYFDKIWNAAGLMTREECYQWLADKLGVKEFQSHFKNLNNEQCAEAIYYCQQLLNDNRRLDLDFGTEPITPLYDINLTP